MEKSLHRSACVSTEDMVLGNHQLSLKATWYVYLLDTITPADVAHCHLLKGTGTISSRNSDYSHVNMHS